MFDKRKFFLFPKTSLNRKTTVVGILLNFINYLHQYQLWNFCAHWVQHSKFQFRNYELWICKKIYYKRLFFQFDNRWRCERFMPKRNNFCLFFSYELNISKSWVICWKNSQKNYILQIQYSFLWDLSHILWSHSKALAEEWLILYMYIYDFWFKIIQFLTQNHVFVLSYLNGHLTRKLAYNVL